jgi:Holliday junction DNA helicase RuvB
LRGRFGLFFDFDFYENVDLAQIVKRSAQLLDIHIDETSSLEIASRSRGSPRLCNRILKRVRDYAQVRAEGIIDFSVTKKALAQILIDESGLDELDRKYLKALIELHQGGPAGIESIAASLGEDRGTLEDVVEPYLLNKGFIVRTQRGRIATELSYKHFNIAEREIRNENS